MTDTMRAIVLDAPGPARSIDYQSDSDTRADCGLGTGPGEGFRPQSIRTSHPPRPRRRRDIPEGAGHRGRRRSGELPRRGAHRRPASRRHDGWGWGGRSTAVMPSTRAFPSVRSFPSRANWTGRHVGAVPEMLQTSYGSLTVGLDAKSGQSLLIRGGTSSVGMATAVLAKQWRTHWSLRPPEMRTKRRR